MAKDHGKLLHELMGWRGPVTLRQHRVWLEWAFPGEGTKARLDDKTMQDLVKKGHLNAITGGGKITPVFKTRDKPLPMVDASGNPVEE